MSRWVWLSLVLGCGSVELQVQPQLTARQVATRKRLLADSALGTQLPSIDASRLDPVNDLDHNYFLGAKARGSSQGYLARTNIGRNHKGTAVQVEYWTCKGLGMLQARFQGVKTSCLIGTSAEAFNALVGAPTHTDGRWWIYPIETSHQEQGRLQAIFETNRLVRLSFRLTRPFDQRDFR
jgi:hypothetical protein